MSRWRTSDPNQCGPVIETGPPQSRRIVRIVHDKDRVFVQIEEYNRRDVESGAEIGLDEQRLAELIARLRIALRLLRGESVGEGDGRDPCGPADR